jgi:hypothetical protein
MDSEDSDIIVEETEDSDMDEEIGKFDNTKADVMRLKSELKKAVKENTKLKRTIVTEIDTAVKTKTDKLKK